MEGRILKSVRHKGSLLRKPLILVVINTPKKSIDDSTLIKKYFLYNFWLRIEYFRIKLSECQEIVDKDLYGEV